MELSITPIPLTRAGSTKYGTCTSGWIARRWAATSKASGGSATMNMATTEPRTSLEGVTNKRSPSVWGGGAGVHRQHCLDGRLVLIDVGDAGHGNARWLDHDDDVDAQS